jgi:protein involved in polysaccharide export with SLBB domain
MPGAFSGAAFHESLIAKEYMMPLQRSRSTGGSRNRNNDAVRLLSVFGLCCALIVAGSLRGQTRDARDAGRVRPAAGEDRFLEMAAPRTLDDANDAFEDETEVDGKKEYDETGREIKTGEYAEGKRRPEPNDVNIVRPAAKPMKKASERSAIEKLLAGELETEVSKELKQFGYDVFDVNVSTFAPIEDVPVGGDYVVGPGDTFVVTLWGRVNEQYRVMINRNGEVALPEIGMVRVSGMTFDAMESFLQDQFSRKHTDFRMAVTMGRLRSIRAFVVGEAKAPGSFTVSSLSTVINALFAAGGPSKNGSLRNIRLSRTGQERVIIDLYDFFLGGDKSKDLRLQDGDTIFIPLIGPVVGVAGNVKRPAIYELKEEKTLGEVLELAGGVTYAGWLQRVQIERVEEHERRIVADFDLTEAGVGAGREAPIKDGDLVNVFAVTPYQENVVYLEGHVLRPGKYEVHEGMKLSDIITSYKSLLPGANMEHAEIARLVEPDYHPVIIPVNLGRLLAGYSSEDVELKRYDTITVYRWDEQGKKSVTVSGMVYRPGEYRYYDGMTVSELLEAAGGPEKNAYLKSAELTRRNITQTGMETQKIDIDLRRVLEKDPEHDLLLQDYDHLIVRSIPELEFDRFVEIQGEVMFPGRYPIIRGERLSSLIERAGGYTNRAYLKGAVFTRQSAKIVQRRRMDRLISEIEEAVLTSTDIAISGALDQETVETQQLSLKAKRELLAKLRAAQIDGRVVVRLSDVERLRGSRHDLELEKGDVLQIPETPGVVHVVGQVFNPTSILYDPSWSVEYYLTKVGGVKKEADEKQISVIRADGSVVSIAQKDHGKVSWDSDVNAWNFGGFMSMKLNPGDTIVVPYKLDRFLALKTTKDIATTVFQLALAAGVVAAL